MAIAERRGEQKNSADSVELEPAQEPHTGNRGISRSCKRKKDRSDEGVGKIRGECLCLGKAGKKNNGLGGGRLSPAYSCWREGDGSTGEVMKSIRKTYWEFNDNADLMLRKELGL